jgi:hypothetical protein
MVVMPGDGAPSPFTIPGTARTYTCSSGSAITVPGEDGIVLQNHNWVGLGAGLAGKWSAGPTTARPTVPNLAIGHVHIDTTENLAVIYGGPVTGWMNIATGATE